MWQVKLWRLKATVRQKLKPPRGCELSCTLNRDNSPPRGNKISTERKGTQPLRFATIETIND